jgi:RNA polymerase sigma-70 factor (ECF subfamily)
MQIVADAETLFGQHRARVFRYLCRIVGRDEAHDLTQEVFLRVTRAVIPDAPDSGRRAWVFRIARNLAINHVRDASHRRAVVMPVETASPATQELAAAIQQALDTLGDIDRDVFLLRESAGLDYGEIAETCELTRDAVRARLKRTRQELREALSGQMRAHRHRPISFGIREGDDT